MEGYKKTDLGKSILSSSQKIFFMCLLVFIFGLGFGAKANAATYYVDSSITDTHVASSTPDFTTYNHTSFETTGGSDSVFKTIADINAFATLQPGDNVYFRKGQTWREQLIVLSSGSEDNLITFGAYGSGNKPIINGADIFNSGWSLYSGTTYKRTSAVITVLVSVDGVIATKGVGIDTLNDHTWFQINGVLYFRDDTGNPNDGVNDPILESAQRNRGIDLNGQSYISINNIKLSLFRNSGIYQDGGGNNVISDNEIYGAYYWGIILYDSSNNVVNDNTLSGMFYYSGIDIIEDNGDTNNNIVHDNLISDAWREGIHVHGKSGSDRALNNTVYHNTTEGCGDGIYYRFTDGGDIYNNTSRNNTGTRNAGEGYGIAISRASNHRVYGNTVYGNRTDGIALWSSSTLSMNSDNNVIYKNYSHSNSGFGISMTGSSGADNNDVYYNVIYNNTNIGIRLSAVNVNSDIYNNTVVGNAEGIYLGSSATSISVKNNIFSNNTNYALRVTSANLATISNNLYYKSSGDVISVNGVGYTADHVTSVDLNGIGQNPNLSNPSGGDFVLTSASPAIDSGTNVSLTSDYSGNPIYGVPDIGAYEYQPTHDMGAPTPDEPQIGEAIRVYGDGKFRNTVDDSEDNATDTAELSIVPQTSETTKWLDLNIATWNTSGDRRKTWTENGDNLEEGDEIVNTLHTIGDLVSGQAYSVRIDDALATGNITGANCVSGVCTADENGEISFIYTGGYSNHTFDVKDQTAPAVNIISPETGDTVSADDTIAFTDSEATSPKCSLNHTDWNDCQSLVTNFNDLTGWNDIEEKSTFTLYLKDTDAANNTGTDQVDNLTKADTQAPIRSNGSPSGELAAGTTSVTLGLKTDENATCRYDTAPKNYDDMVNTFTTTGEKNHSQTITSLTPEISYSYYVRCQDTSEAQNTNDTNYLISFSVANEEITDNDDNAERDINVNKVKAVSTENSITITWKTDHNAKSTIRYGTNKNLKEKKKDNQKEKNHKVTLKNLLPDTKYYFKIKSIDGDNNEDSSRIHSIKTQPKEISKSQNTPSVQNETTISNDSRIGNTVPNVCSYTVQAGDSLWSIAQKVYGDRAAYPLIIEKNKDKYTDIESKLSIGQELIFCDNNPKSQTTGNNSNTDNSGQQSQSQNQTQSQPETRTFHWWNPFTWF